jgi:hypothetical protein
MRKPDHLAHPFAHLFAGIICRFRDGVVTKHWDELNTLEVFQQMGSISLPGASA